MAVSLPEPGPFTSTSTRRTPCSWARREAASAASCAANGVDLREPLKPTFPADAHDTTFPSRSVIEMMVLLNVDLMWATPWTTFFFSLRRAFFFLGAANTYPLYFFPLAFFLPATVFFGPLRVRAFVWVRCPCTGRPRRWRSPWYDWISTLRLMFCATSRR